jgi:hypothetical protein
MLGQAVLRAEGAAYGLGHEGRVTQCGQLDPEDAGLELGHELRRCLQGEPRLAGAAGTAQCDQARPIPEHRNELVPLTLTADQRRGRPRQVRVRDRLQGREGLAADLEKGDRVVEVLEPVLSQCT